MNSTVIPAISESAVSQPAEVAEVVIQDGPSYCIITGSFKSRENAELQSGALKDAGFDPEIITAPNGFFRVSAARCSTLGSALGKKDSIAGKFPGSWVKKI